MVISEDVNSCAAIWRNISLCCICHWCSAHYNHFVVALTHQLHEIALHALNYYEITAVLSALSLVEAIYIV